MIRDKLKNFIHRTLKDNDGFKDVDLVIQRPKTDGFGDFSTPVAMTLAKKTNKNPLELAEKIVCLLVGDKESQKYFSKIEAIKPGFINFYLTDEFLRNQVEEILEKEGSFGENNLGQNKKAQVEFISANPTGPLTLGNGRGGIYGDILGNVLAKSGFKVTKEYYINDAGGQIEKLGHSILKDEQAEYRGDYINELNKTIKEKDPRRAGSEAQKIILEQIKKTVAEMGIEFDTWFSEQKELRDTDAVEKVFAWLEKKDLAYEREGALWFRAEKFGDEKDRPLRKSDGEPTYFGVDCAYHKNKFVERKFDKVINVWGADHHGDVARLRGFVEALGKQNNFKIILLQFVRLVQGGREVRMSKRKGVYITVDEILEEVGRDAFRFFMAMYSANTHMDFDLALAKEQSQKNPVYYVQYGHARISSILAKIKDVEEKTKDLNLLKEKEELALIRQLIRYPEIIEDVACDYQVQRLPQYALDLVTTFHKFYERCQVLGKDKKQQAARLRLVRATQFILRDLLENVLGVSVPQKM